LNNVKELDALENTSSSTDINSPKIGRSNTQLPPSKSGEAVNIGKSQSGGIINLSTSNSGNMERELSPMFDHNETSKKSSKEAVINLF
jgi:hypothetical protein